MVWIKNNDILNPRVTTLPPATGSHYVEGSIVVIEASYGIVEWKIIGGVWTPVKALTDINMFIDVNGVNSILNGSSDTPLQTTQYATTLIPKQIKNLNITLMSTTEDPAHSGLCVLKDLIKTNESDIITISGDYDITYGEMPTEIASVTYAMGNRVKVLHLATSDLPTGVIHADEVDAIGVDPITGLQYITQPAFDFKLNGVYAGAVIQNTTTNEFSFVAGTRYDDQGYLFISDPIFNNATESYQILSGAFQLRWIMIDPNSGNVDTAGKCFPVIANTSNALFVLNNEGGLTDITTGDFFYGVNFPLATIQLENIDHIVKLNKLMCVGWQNGGENTISHFINCTKPVVNTEVYYESLLVQRTPEFIFNRSIFVYLLEMSHCNSTVPVAHTLEVCPDLDYTYNRLSPDNNYDTGIVILNSLLYISTAIIYKSIISVQKSWIDGSEWSPEDGGETTGLVQVSDSYVRVDGDNILLNTETLPGFYVSNNGVFESRYGDIYRLMADTVVDNHSETGSYRYTSRKTYVSIDALLADTLVANHVIGLIETEPGNMYTRMDNMWVPRSGNQYTTEQSDVLFAAPNVMIPNGLEIFNTTIGREVTWLEPEQAT